MRSFSGGWRSLLRIGRRDPGADIDAELGFHFDQKVAELHAGGMALEDARARALEEFGDLQDVKRDLGEIDRRIAVKRQRAQWWEAIAQDGGYVLRTLRRSPGFTAMVATTLALGIGANAVILSLLDRLFMREPAAVSAPQQVHRLVQQYKDGRGQPNVRFDYTWPELRDVRSALGDGAPVAGYRLDHLTFGVDDDAPPAAVSYVEGDFFGVLGVRPAAGRFFSAEEARIQNVTQLAVISHQLWHDRFGGASSVVGQAVEVGSQRYTIIGVAPAGFSGIDFDAVDIWAPVSTMRPVDADSPWYDAPGGGGRVLRFVTRVASPAGAARIIGASAPALRHGGGVRDTAATVTLAPVGQPIWTDGGTVVAISTRLAGVAAIILMIACANVANLFLARGMQRRREVAVRLALGVSRRRLVGQLLGESVAVAMIGGAAAVVVAAWSGGVLRRMLLPDVRWAEPAIGMRVAAFTAAVALLAGVAAGLVPALQASRPDLARALKAGAREGTFHRSRLRTGLLVVQGALSMVLLAGAGLFVQSLRHVEAVDIGYDADRLVLASVRYANDSLNSHRDQELKVHLPEIAARIARLPGVERVGLAESPLMNGVEIYNMFLPDRDSVPKLQGLPPLASTVSPEYLGAVGTRIVAGRGFTEADVMGSEPVMIVSSSMAKTVWPGENAVGKCIIFANRSEPCRTVVGVVSEGHLVRIIEQPMMRYYLPLAQWPLATPGEIVIRVAPARGGAVSAQTRTLLVDGLGTWAHPRFTSMRERLAPQLRPWRLGVSLFGGAALLALIVAAVGVYSTISYTITQRTHEMGVRVALGARAADILRLVVGEGVRVVALGVVIGACIALALGRLMASVLYATSPRDPVVLAGTAVTLLLVAVVACVIPARRATRVDPMSALRSE